eukprot:1161687-Pelagomonas_calceolata.AAC.5
MESLCASCLNFSPCHPARSLVQTPPQSIAGLPIIPWRQAAASLPACWSVCDGICDGTSTALFQPSLKQASSGPMGRILDLFHVGIIDMALGWKSGLLGGGWVPPRGSLPPETFPQIAP